eukprot:140776-Alexandrium_andersonii.AAC.1
MESELEATPAATETALLALSGPVASVDQPGTSSSSSSSQPLESQPKNDPPIDESAFRMAYERKKAKLGANKQANSAQKTLK